MAEENGDAIKDEDSRRRRILFVGETVTLAHVARPLELADSLDRDRYEIRVACGERFGKWVKAAGFAFSALPSMDGETFMRRLAAGSTLYDLATLRGYVEAEMRLFAEHKPELVVGDFRVSLGISTEAMGLPYANLCNAHWSPYSTLPFPLPELPITRLLGTGLSGLLSKAVVPLALRIQAEPYNRLRRAWGLRPVRDIRGMYSGGTWTLYPDLPELAPTEGLPDRHRYLGPVTWSPRIPLPDWWVDILKADRPIVYMALGSSGETGVARALIEAASDLPLSVALATAERLDRARYPANVFAADYLPGSEVLKSTALCVFNGGAGTGYQALTAGVPLLGLPSSADQFYFMESVERVGAGLLVRPSKASERKLSAALRHLLAEGAFRDSAKRIARSIALRSAREEFPRFVDEVFKAPATGI